MTLGCGLLAEVQSERTRVCVCFVVFVNGFLALSKIST